VESVFVSLHVASRRTAVVVCVRSFRSRWPPGGDFLR
jgi:hypothetical protein